MPKKATHNHSDISCEKPLSAQLDKPSVLSRLSKVKGQLEGIMKMIERDEYCVDLINQCRAARGAVSKVETIILEAHLKACLVDSIRVGDSSEGMINEIVDIYKLSSSGK